MENLPLVLQSLFNFFDLFFQFVMFFVSGEGKFHATGRLKDLLVTSLGEDGFWSVIDEGIPLGKLLLGVIKHPQYIDELAKIGMLYV